MNKSLIEKHANALIEAIEQALEKKQEKENPSDKDEDIISALEDYQNAVSDGLDDLLSAYDA